MASATTTTTLPAVLPATQSSPPPPPPPPITPEPLYAGHTRFELELEFVSMLSSPLYLNHLASLKLLQAPDFVAYLKYLRYWTRPEYITFLSYPGPTIRALELLQEERFRREVLSPEVVGGLMQEGVRGSLEFHGR
ncbi:MAG: suppressor of hpr1 [Alectoria sarmentosa]|nr:MAG: suppressor of hpr1 [Alectoria sarmentosa]